MKELLENANGLIAEFTKNAGLQIENGNKAAGARARKASLEIEKLMKEFRKVSIEESKK
jgi:Histone H1-like protein Hc1.